MEKLRKYTYTIMLILTCAVASPLIFMRIWKTSAIREDAPAAAPVIDLSATYAAPVTTAPPVTETTPAETTSPAEKVQTTAAETTEPAETVTTTAAEPEVSFIKAEDDYFDDALFLGDSRTVGLRDYGTLKNADYFCSVGMTSIGIGGATVDNRTLDGILASRSYGKIYIMLGVNECGGDPEAIAGVFSQLVQKLREAQPDAVIYLMANLHVSKASETNTVNNARICAVNTAVSALADNEHIFCLDVNPVFCDADGYLRAELSNDGVHPLAKYYADWCEWLKLNAIEVETPEPETQAETETDTEPSEAPSEE